MNRPKNRQPRASRKQHGAGAQVRPHLGTQTNVPGFQQVVPGAPVSIVLKSDQPTGRETPGVVKDLLTRGNHPRGIKVRLQDGQVGRVQRMIAPGLATQVQSGDSQTAASGNVFSPRKEEINDFPSLPPPRNLADFIPPVNEPPARDEATLGADIDFTSAVIKCPICDDFEGDEAAVTHHIQGHLT